MNKKTLFAMRIAASYLVILIGMALDIDKSIMIFSIVWFAFSDICHLFTED